MNVTMSNYDCMLIMPTGGGKSLCFQLPAVVSNGFTLVISPLISLMEDQLMALDRLGINAALLSSSIPTKDVTIIQNLLVDKECPYKLVYVTPERIAKSKRFMAKLEKAYAVGNVSRIVIDEVHCASHWGHDFRPDYKVLGILKRQFPKLPILGLTATATKKVLDDVKEMLNLDRTCMVFRASFNRPNLFYEVHQTCLDSKDLIKEVSNVIKRRFKAMSGIIYCFSRKDSEEVAHGLKERGITAHCYHADLDPKLKSYIHQQWTNGEIQVVVATIAFGMGIDKPNVRFVIHFSISKSIENYYQESGRAGRDDQKAWCILYFRFQDIFRQSSMVFTEKMGLHNLYLMINYCLNKTTCRRKQIGLFFSENWEANQCKETCDVCFEKAETKDLILNKDALNLLDILENAKYKQERLTPLKLVELWLGKGKVSLRKKQASYPKEICELIVAKLIAEQILTEDFHFTPYNTITYILPGPRKHLVTTLKKRGGDIIFPIPCNSQMGKDGCKKEDDESTNQSTRKRVLSESDDENVKVKMEKEFKDLTSPVTSSLKKQKTNAIIIDSDDNDEDDFVL